MCAKAFLFDAREKGKAIQRSHCFRKRTHFRTKITARSALPNSFRASWQGLRVIGFCAGQSSDGVGLMISESRQEQLPAHCVYEDCSTRSVAKNAQPTSEEDA